MRWGSEEAPPPPTHTHTHTHAHILFFHKEIHWQHFARILCNNWNLKMPPSFPQRSFFLSFFLSFFVFLSSFLSFFLPSFPFSSLFLAFFMYFTNLTTLNENVFLSNLMSLSFIPAHYKICRRRKHSRHSVTIEDLEGDYSFVQFGVFSHCQLEYLIYSSFIQYTFILATGVKASYK